MTAKRLIAVAGQIDGLPAKIRQAQVRALSSTARKGRALMIAALREESALPARYVAGKVIGRRVGNVAEVAAPRQGRIPAVAYPHRAVPGKPRGKGYKVRFAPGDWQQFPKAFAVQKIKTKFGPLVFQRTGADRFPIEPLMGPSVGDLFALHSAAVAEEAGAFFAVELARQMNLEGNR